MKILIDLTSLADNFSGIERYAACLSREMLKENNEYILIFKDYVHPIFTPFNNFDNIEIICIPGCHKLIFNQLKLPLEIFKHKADIYLFMGFPVPVFLFKKNMISTMHDICCWDCPETMNGISKWYFRLSHRIAILKCKRIITISEFSRERIINKLHYDKNKIWMIYCGVDDRFLQYCQKSDDKKILRKYQLPEKYMLSLSTIEPRKNLRLLIDAYEKILEKKTDCMPLVLAGRKGWKVDGLLDGIASEVRKKIIFTGFIDDIDLPIIYAYASLFIFPSMYEGFGVPPLEALACGTPVLSSDSSSLPEVLGDCADYFKSNDIDSLQEGIECFLNNKTKKRTKDELHQQLDKFDWNNEAKSLLSKMKGLL